MLIETWEKIAPNRPFAPARNCCVFILLRCWAEPEANILWKLSTKIGDLDSCLVRSTKNPVATLHSKKNVQQVCDMEKITSRWVLFRWEKIHPRVRSLHLPEWKNPGKKVKQLLCSKLFGQNISTPLPKTWNFEEAWGMFLCHRMILVLVTGCRDPIEGKIYLVYKRDILPIGWLYATSTFYKNLKNPWIFGVNHFDQDVLRSKPGEVAP